MGSPNALASWLLKKKTTHDDKMPMKIENFKAHLKILSAFLYSPLLTLADTSLDKATGIP